jgi:ABC-type transporter Mla subunit MlaD
MPLDNKGAAAEKAGLDRLKLEARRASAPFALFVLLMVAGLFTSAQIIRNLAGDKPWVHYEPYKAAFTDAKGVVPSRVELRLAGVKAGSIKKSELIHGQAVLTLNLEQKYAPLYKDAQVRIRPITPLEDMYVDIISRGHEAAGKLGRDDILPTSRTISPVQIGNVLQTFDGPTRTNLASLLNQLGRGLDDGGTDLRWAFTELTPFFANATKVLDALAERRQNMKRFVTSFSGIAGELAQKDTQLASFVKHGDEVLGSLAQNDGPFAATLAELPGTLQTMQRSFANLRRTEAVLDPTLRSLRPVAAKLPAGLDSLSDFAEEATPALRALRTPVKELRPLTRAVRPTSRSLVGVFDQLKVQAPQLDKGIVMAVPCLPETGTLLSRVMSATKLGDATPAPAKASVGNFRADVHVDFNSLGEFFPDPQWKRYVPCHQEDKIKGGDRITNP